MEVHARGAQDHTQRALQAVLIVPLAALQVPDCRLYRDGVLAGLVRHYGERVLDVEKITSAMVRNGVVATAGDIENDHIASGLWGRATRHPFAQTHLHASQLWA